MKLVEFDKNYLEQIDKERKVLFDESGIYHTIELDGERIGVVGFIPTKDNGGFVQIVIIPQYRGNGLTKAAEELLVKRYKLNYLLATIDQDNQASLKAHFKAGFEFLPEEEIGRLRKMGRLAENKIRLIKRFK